MKPTLLFNFILSTQLLFAQSFTEVPVAAPFIGVGLSSMAFADVNGDTHPDVLITAADEQLRIITRLYLNDGLATSVSQLEGNAPLRAVVFPNPNLTDRATIRYQAPHSGYLQVRLLDVSGRVKQVQRVGVVAGPLKA